MIFIITKLQEGMSEEIDFIMPAVSQIKFPQRSLKAPVKQENKPKSKTFQIEKSFVPEQKSKVHEKMRPQIDKIKMLLKAKNEKQKRIKQLVAEGVIDRKDLQPKQEPKKEQEPKEKLVVDQTGKLRDEKGNLVFIKNQTTQFKINQKKAHQDQLKELGKKQKIKFHQKLSKNLKDKNLVIGTSKRRYKKSLFGLQFVDQDDLQPDQSLKQEINDLNQVVKTDNQRRIIRKKIKSNLNFNKEIPKVQWWDSEILNIEAYENSENAGQNLQQFIDLTKLSNPVSYQKVGSETKKQAKVHIPLYLTKDERKKLKRKRKRQKLIQKNDMIRLGLIEPEKPKLKISNMAVVMKDEFIMDPSKIEKMAKEQVEERLNKHLQINQQRKLTKAQKKDKIIRKLKRDSAKECRRILFKLKNIDNPSHAFKVNMNARQLALNGFIIKPNQFYRQNVLIVAEGGQKAIKFFKHLMINRIKWGQEHNECKILWEGQVASTKMGKWRTIQVADQLETSKALKQRNLQNFYEYIV